MADRYWVGGTSATWNTTTHWSASSGGPSGASVPTASDNVFFNSSSGSGFSVTLNVAATMLNFTCSGCSVTFSGSLAFQISGSVSVDSNVTFNTTSTFTLNATGSVNISIGTSLNTSALVFNAAGTFNLLSDITNASTSSVTHNAGTVVFNGHTVTSGSWVTSGALARSMDMSADNSKFIGINTAANAVIVNMGTIGGLTTNITGLNSGMYTSCAQAHQIAYGSSGATTSNMMNIYAGGGGVCTISGTASYFNYLEYNTPAGTGANPTILPHTGGSYVRGFKNNAGVSAIYTGTLTFSGSDTYSDVIFSNAGNYSYSNLAFNRSGSGAGVNVYGSFSTPSTGSVGLNNGFLNFMNAGDTITCGTFNCNNTVTRSINAQSSAVLPIGSKSYANIVYMTGGTTRLSMPNVTGFSYTGSFAFAANINTTGTTFAYGTTAGSTPISNLCPPLHIYAGSSAPTITSSSTLSTLDFTGHTGSPVGSNIYVKELILATGASGGYGSVSPIFTNSTGSLTSNGRVLGTLTVGTGTYAGYLQLNDAASCSTLTLSQGSLYLQGLTLTCSGTATLSAVSPFYLNFASGRIVLSNATGGAVVWSAPTLTNFTTDQTGGLQMTAAVARTVQNGNTAGATLTNIVNLYVTSGGSLITMSGSTFNLIDATGTTNNILAVSNQTIKLVSFKAGISNYASVTTVTFNFIGTGTLDTSGLTVTMPLITINATGTYTTGTVPTYGLTLIGNIMVQGASLTLNSGTLNLNGYGITGASAATVVTYNLGASSVTGLLFNGGYITINNTTAAQTPVNFANTTNLYTDWYKGSGGFAAAMSVTRTFNIGGTAAGPYLINVYLNSGAAVPTLNGSGFGIIDFSGSTCNPGAVTLTCSGLTLASGGTYTSTSATFIGTVPSSTTGYSAACATFTPNGKTIAGMNVNALWTGYVAGVSYTNYNSATVLGGAVTYATTTATTTLTSGTLKLNGYTLTTGVFVYTSGSVASILFNTGTIVLANSTTNIYVLNMPDLTNFTNDQNGGFSIPALFQKYIVGTTASPLQSTSASNLKFTLTGSGSAVPIWDPGCTIGYADFSAVPNSSIFVFTPPYVTNFGYLKLPANPNSSTNIFNFKYLWPTMGFETGESTAATVSIQPSANVSAPNFVLTGNLTVTNTLTYAPAANIDLKGYSITASSFVGNASGTGNIICTAANSTTSAINLSGSGNVWASNNITVMSNVRVNLTSTSAKAIDGNGHTTFGNVNNTGVGNLTIQNSDTFGNLNIVANPTTLTFTTGKQPVINYLYANGNSTSGNLVTINSNNPGTLANVQVTHPLSIDYVSIKDIQAITTTWYANTHSVNGGNNVNIVFPNGVNGQFFAFY